MCQRGYLKRFDAFIAFLETLEEKWVARRAMRALEEWKSDPSTARPWREVFAELNVDIGDE